MPRSVSCPFLVRSVLVIATIAFVTACSSTGSSGTQHAAAGASPQPQPAQLFEGLGSHTRTVSTKNPQAQNYFNQALIWTFSFNHDEAIRTYQKGNS